LLQSCCDDLQYINLQYCNGKGAHQYSQRILDDRLLASKVALIEEAALVAAARVGRLDLRPAT
jgi:hypothetical protein